MIRHRPAYNPAAVQIHDGGQIEPALIGLDVGDIGQPDLVRSSGDEVAVEQIRGDWQVVAAVGGSHPAWPRHDGSDAVTPHQPLDATTARPAALSLQLDMDTRAAITPAGVAVDPPDVVDEVTIGGRSSALRARAPGIIAGRRDTEHVAQEPHRIIGAAIFDEAESHVRVPAILKCRAPCAAARSLAVNARSPPRGPPTAASPALWGAASPPSALAGPLAAPPIAAPPNRAGQAPWPQLRSSARSTQRDQPPAACSRP